MSPRIKSGDFFMVPHISGGKIAKEIRKMKYFHVWFQTKRKRRILIDEIDKEISIFFEEISKNKNIRLVAHGTLPDHAHLLLELTNRDELPKAVKFLKGISARRIFKTFPILKEQMKINNLWARKYAFKEVPEEALVTVSRYVSNQKKDLHLI